MLELLKNIKFAIGVISTIALILSAFRFEVINVGNGGGDDDYYYEQSLTVDKKTLDALARFDRNVRHLHLRGRQTNNNDCAHILPDFQQALESASIIIQDYKKLLQQQNKFNNEKSGKLSKLGKHRKNKKKTISYSFQFGSKIYMMSFYWPKLMEVLFGTSD